MADRVRATYVVLDEAATEQHVPVICPACQQGWHGGNCQPQFWTTDEPPVMVECDCVEGSCRGEWQDLGMTEERITVDVEEVRRTAEAIEVLATAPEEYRETVARGVLDGVTIAKARPVFAPTAFSIPGRIGADGRLVLGEPEPVEQDDEPPRYRLNRADRRRLTKRGRRRG